MPKPKNYTETSGKWKGRKYGSYKWFETQDSIAYHESFQEPKIIYPNMTKYMPFVYDKHQFFTNDKSFIITGVSLSYLTAFLNSKLFRFTFKDYFPELLGDTRELRKIFFETVTVKTITEHGIFDQYAARIEKSKLLNLSTTEIELEIEEWLFDHYELTGEERLVVNKSTSLSTPSELFIKSKSAVVSE